MFVDIHTHHRSDLTYPSIRNLVFSNGEFLFLGDEELLFSIGIHPYCADEFTFEVFAKLEECSKDSRCVSIGECGLDKNCNVSLELQLFVFEQHIALSERMHKPLIIHCVGCFNELFALKCKWKPRQLWIIHAFRGKPQLALQALKHGFSLSFGEYFNAESVRVTPFDKLFVETDESKQSIDSIYAQICRAKNCRPDELIAGDCLIRDV